MAKSYLLLLFFSILLISCSKESDPEPIDLIYHGDVFLLNQQEVDSFSKEEYSIIDGDLVVGGLTGYNDIVSVAGLSSITEVKDLAVQSTMLTSLEGLHNLTSVSQVFIYKNSRLKAINNLSLKETTTAGLAIERNNSLEDISGFGNLQGEIYRVEINNNPLLKSLEGLDGLEVIEERLQIINNPNLENLHPLAGLTTAASVKIINNAKLKNLEGLENLQSSSWFEIGNNENLVSLEGLHGLTTLTKYMEIYGNKNLSNFCGLGNLVSRPNGWYIDLRISNNFINPSQEELLNGSCSQ